jgi:hypothetical protein
MGSTPSGTSVFHQPDSSSKDICPLVALIFMFSVGVSLAVLSMFAYLLTADVLGFREHKHAAAKNMVIKNETLRLWALDMRVCTMEQAWSEAAGQQLKKALSRHAEAIRETPVLLRADFGVVTVNSNGGVVFQKDKSIQHAQNVLKSPNSYSMLKGTSSYGARAFSDLFLSSSSSCPHTSGGSDGGFLGGVLTW